MTSTDLTTTSTDVIEHTPENEQLIRQQFRLESASPAEMMWFFAVCRRTGLDPISRQIYGVMRSGKLTIQTGIDGFRATADKTQRYAGSEDAVFTGQTSDGKYPAKATVTVCKIVQGIVCNFTASARWDEYYPGEKLGSMWRKMPHVMLGKCAEAQALRKAFSTLLVGVYEASEMDQAGRDTVEPAAAPQLAPRRSATPVLDERQVGIVVVLAESAGLDGNPARSWAAKRTDWPSTVAAILERIRTPAELTEDQVEYLRAVAMEPDATAESIDEAWHGSIAVTGEVVEESAPASVEPEVAA